MMMECENAEHMKVTLRVTVNQTHPEEEIAGEKMTGLSPHIQHEAP